MIDLDKNGMLGFFSDHGCMTTVCYDVDNDSIIERDYIGQSKPWMTMSKHISDWLITESLYPDDINEKLRELQDMYFSYLNTPEDTSDMGWF